MEKLRSPKTGPYRWFLRCASAASTFRCSRALLQRGRTQSELSGAAIAALQAYDWPGTIRELRNVLKEELRSVERAAKRLGIPPNALLQDAQARHPRVSYVRCGVRRQTPPLSNARESESGGLASALHKKCVSSSS